MGCHSGKVSAPKVASGNPLSAEHTLLAGPPGQSPIKQVTKEAALAQEVHSCGSAAFDGAWTRGAIGGNRLIWSDGSISLVTIDHATGTIQVISHGNSLAGALREDGKIHWDNGDIWCRQSEAVQGNLETPVLDSPSAHSAVHPSSTEDANSGDLLSVTGHASEVIQETVKAEPSLEQNATPQDAAANTTTLSAQVNVADDTSKSEFMADSQAACQIEEAPANVDRRPDARDAVVEKNKAPTCQADTNAITPPAAPRKERGWVCC